MHLYVFDTLESVLRNGSLAGAAAEMNLTPSAVSMQMKQLEAHFGQPLFDRSRRRVQATALAREIVELMRSPLNRLTELRHQPTLAVAGPISLGVIETMQMGLLPSAVAHLRKRHPALQVRPVRGRSVELLESVKAAWMPRWWCGRLPVDRSGSTGSRSRARNWYWWRRPSPAATAWPHCFASTIGYA